MNGCCSGPDAKRSEDALERLQKIVGYAMDALYGNPVPKDAAVNYALVGRAKRVYDAWLAAENKIEPSGL